MVVLLAVMNHWSCHRGVNQCYQYYSYILHIRLANYQHVTTYHLKAHILKLCILPTVLYESHSKERSYR